MIGHLIPPHSPTLKIEIADSKSSRCQSPHIKMSIVAPEAIPSPTIPIGDVKYNYNEHSNSANGLVDSSLDQLAYISDGAQNQGVLRVDQPGRSCTDKTFGPWILLFKSIIPDFRGLFWWHWAFILLFCICVVTFSFIDLNYWIYPDTVSSWKAWENLEGMSTFAVVSWYLSSVSSFTGALCVFMGARGKFSNFFWGLINVVLYSCVAFSMGMAGDAQLNAFIFFPLNIFGLYSWYNSMLNDTSNDESITAQSKSLKLYQWAIIAVLATGIAAFLYWEIMWFSFALTGDYVFADMPVPRALDAISTSLSIFAQVLLMLQFWENWALWYVTSYIG
jgi:nicotinamide mononucleotide transporter PnuC